jgi:hypothetical protein
MVPRAAAAAAATSGYSCIPTDQHTIARPPPYNEAPLVLIRPVNTYVDRGCAGGRCWHPTATVGRAVFSPSPLLMMNSARLGTLCTRVHNYPATTAAVITHTSRKCERRFNVALTVAKVCMSVPKERHARQAAVAGASKPSERTEAAPLCGRPDDTRAANLASRAPKARSSCIAAIARLAKAQCRTGARLATPQRAKSTTSRRPRAPHRKSFVRRPDTLSGIQALAAGQAVSTRLEVAAAPRQRARGRCMLSAAHANKWAAAQRGMSSPGRPQRTAAEPADCCGALPRAPTAGWERGDEW